ncbi:hypothetical protein GE115_12010 [Agromyces sp. CFH 90414]|uniref:Large extracellular alpha-helical protein n=1 Tax=Agromyces agglutinans TaxID=2662258 RepID=A0A6I2F563_9MICO|nr:DUF5719 family protein [Agromyces agglutinans]MRG60585.1 hypothetical protein [Agromyces agglutinans]
MARRPLIGAGLRTLAAVGALAAGGVLVFAGLQAPWPEYRADAASVVVEPAESRQVRVCPGPLLELADDAAAATNATSFGSADLVTVAEPPSALVEEAPLENPANREAGSDGQAVALVAEPGEVAAGLLAGAQSQEAETETIAGLAVAACRDAVAESWLVGGSTALGRTTLVLLANPTDVAATVDLRVSGEAGAVDAPSALGIQVPPFEQRVVSLAGLAPNLASPVVHVVATGGRIAASLQQTAIDGLLPAGVDLVGATAAPAQTQHITGVLVAESGGVAVDEDHLDGDGFPVLRLFVPGDEPAEVTVGVVPGQGGAGTTIDAELIPGEVTDVPLGELRAGTYTLDVESDVPVVAAARTSVAPVPATGDTQSLGEPGDFAWFPASSPLAGEIAVAIADAASPVLHLSNPTDAPVTAILDLAGSEREVEVDAGGATSVELDGDDGAVIRDADGLHASVVYDGGRTIAAAPVEPPGPQDAPIRVFPN